MKKIYCNFCAIITVLALSSFGFSLSSCTKEVLQIDTVTIHDTIIKEAPIPVLDTLSILTGKQWQINEIRFLQDDSPYYYKRGALNNNANFDNEYIKFNADFTGIYYSDGNTNSITWAFKDADKTRITYTISFGTPLVVNWENIQYNANFIKYSEYYKKNGVNSLAGVWRIPR